MLRIIKPQKMSLTKEIAEQENHRTTADRMELHLWKEGSFMRAYDWSDDKGQVPVIPTTVPPTSTSAMKRISWGS